MRFADDVNHCYMYGLYVYYFYKKIILNFESFQHFQGYNDKCVENILNTLKYYKK